MYLSYIQITNFRNISNSRFVFSQGANTVVGENDSGKSNAITAIRLLLDDSYYTSPKRLKDSDFSYDLGDWRGHWIIISAIFDGITLEEKQTEVCAEFVPDEEDANFLSSYIKCSDKDIGIVTMFIRPIKIIRKKLSQAHSKEAFEAIRNTISVNDYEFYYTSRAQTDFTDPEIYKEIVGNFKSGKYADPDDYNLNLMGAPINIRDAQTHISVVYIDALRDVQNELHKSNNPIRRMIDTIQSQIQTKDKEEIKQKINDLNSTITSIDAIDRIGANINDKLRNMIGVVYSPDLSLESTLNDDLSTLSRYLTLKPAEQNDIDLLGLGHLNMIYISLKLVEFEITHTRELLNLMLIEEPEAHIHNHIQKTLFDNMKISQSYTQVIMTTHSTHLSEASEISRVNVMKVIGNSSICMQPGHLLDDFGKRRLNLKNLSLSKSIERYMDAKRSVLMFSKGVILVEGDGEEILLPNIAKKGLGVSLDELGIGLINIGSVSFEYIACLFADERIQKKCAIVTDSDVQAVSESSRFYSKEAEAIGKARASKLESLFKDNNWVNAFYAQHTLEIDFAEAEGNREYIKKIISINYEQTATISKHINALKSDKATRANTILTLADSIKKGWYATILSEIINELVIIPDYILSAIVFASLEVISRDILSKIVDYALSGYEQKSEVTYMRTEIKGCRISGEIQKEDDLFDKFINEYSDNMAAKFMAEYRIQSLLG